MDPRQRIVRASALPHRTRGYVFRFSQTMNITSIDFETVNHSEASICAAGIAVFEDRQLTESRHWLVRPPKGHGWFREDFIECHGLTWSDVPSLMTAPRSDSFSPIQGRLAGA